MELSYDDKLHLIEKHYKKLANSISKILKGPKKVLHHYPNITYDQHVIKISSFANKTQVINYHILHKQSYLFKANTSIQVRPPEKNRSSKSQKNQMVVTAENRNEKMSKKISTSTSTFSSLEIQNTTTTINNNNNNKHYNDKNNNSNSKEKNNTLITIVLPKTDASFNHVPVKEEKAPVPKKVLLRQNTNIEKHPQKNQIHLPKLKGGRSTRELKPDNSSCVTCFVQNLSMLWSYVTNTFKLPVIPVILGLL